MEPESYSIRTDYFEGPLALLLHLVKKNKMDIKEISIKLISMEH